GAAAGIDLPAAAPGLAAARHACRGEHSHPLVLARAGTVCLGPGQRAGLLADAGLTARQRLAPLAGDPDAGGAAGPSAGRAGDDHRADGDVGRADRLCAAAALRGSFGKYDRLGSRPSRRPAACRTSDVGTGNLALSRRRALVSLVELAASRASSVTIFLKFVH